MEFYFVPLIEFLFVWVLPNTLRFQNKTLYFYAVKDFLKAHIDIVYFIFIFRWFVMFKETITCCKTVLNLAAFFFIVV